MQDEMMDLMDVSTEIQESLGRSYNVPDYIDEDELLGGKAIIVQFCNLFKCSLNRCRIVKILDLEREPRVGITTAVAIPCHQIDYCW